MLNEGGGRRKVIRLKLLFELQDTFIVLQFFSTVVIRLKFHSRK